MNWMPDTCQCTLTLDDETGSICSAIPSVCATHAAQLATDGPAVTGAHIMEVNQNKNAVTYLLEYAWAMDGDNLTVSVHPSLVDVIEALRVSMGKSATIVAME
jgi:hypothetical protein